MNSVLKALFPEHSKEEFLKSFASNNPLIGHNINSNIQELSELPFLESIEGLFNIWPFEVNAYLPGIADEVNSTKVDSKKATELFNNGSGLFFDDPHRISPIISRWLETLKAEIQLPQVSFAQSLIYLIKKDQGTDPHFDQNINFVIQLHGEKKWWLAPNEHIENPTQRHTIGTPLSSELGHYSNKLMPETFPENCSEYLLKPGSVMFLPRGVWHKTKALEDSVSLNFTYSPPTLLDLFMINAREELIKNPAWRRFATMAPNNTLFQDLLNDLKQDDHFWNHRTQLENFNKATLSE